MVQIIVIKRISPFREMSQRIHYFDSFCDVRQRSQGYQLIESIKKKDIFKITRYLIFKNKFNLIFFSGTNQ